MIRTKAAQGQYDDWTELPLVDQRESAFNQWVAHIQNDTDATENVQIAMELTRLMEAANLCQRRAQNYSERVEGLVLIKEVCNLEPVSL